MIITDEMLSEMESLAKNNYGDWFDKNKKVMLENAQANCEQAIEDIIFSIKEGLKENIEDIAKNMCE